LFYSFPKLWPDSSIVDLLFSFRRLSTACTVGFDHSHLKEVSGLFDVFERYGVVAQTVEVRCFTDHIQEYRPGWLAVAE
jgi:hypothetical protein